MNSDLNVTGASLLDFQLPAILGWKWLVWGLRFGIWVVKVTSRTSPRRCVWHRNRIWEVTRRWNVQLGVSRETLPLCIDLSDKPLRILVCYLNLSICRWVKHSQSMRCHPWLSYLLLIHIGKPEKTRASDKGKMRRKIYSASNTATASAAWALQWVHFRA